MRKVRKRLCQIKYLKNNLELYLFTVIADFTASDLGSCPLEQHISEQM